MSEMKCETCNKDNWKEMCDCCAEADEAGVLEQYLAGAIEGPACVKERAGEGKL